VHKAWLHRKGRKSWLFKPSVKYGELVHTTNRGTIYAIKAGHKYVKPFWIARLLEDQKWIAYEAKLRAASIEFEGAGVYYFNDKQNCSAVRDLLKAVKIFADLRDSSPGVYEGDVLVGHCASHDIIGELDCLIGKYG